MKDANSVYQIQRDHDILSRITLVTCFGDFISFFAILKIIQDSGFKTLYSSSSVIIQATALALAGIIFPRLSSNFNTRTLIIFSQWMSALVAGITLYVYATGNFNLWVSLSTLAILTFCFQIFEGAREHHSKFVAPKEKQSSLQAQLLNSFYGAQFLGPILSFILVQFFPLWIPLLIDLFSFCIAGFVVLKISPIPSNRSNYSIMKPFRYLWKFPKLAKITGLRGIGFWLGAGLYDFLLFMVVTEDYKCDIINSAWIYSMLGLGSMIGIALFRYLIREKIKDQNYNRLWLLSSVANFGIGIFIYIFFKFKLPNFYYCLPVVLAHGLFMGLLAVSSQAIRKHESTNEQFPEIVGFEVIIGRSTSAIVAFLAFLLISYFSISHRQLLIVASSFSIILSIIYFSNFYNYKKQDFELKLKQKT